jgi:hypothetical protein
MLAIGSLLREVVEFTLHGLPLFFCSCLISF